MNKRESIAERLIDARKEKGLTQARLGEKSGTNQAVIQKIENGRSLMPRSIMRIAKALDVNPAWLMFGSEFAGRSTRVIDSEGGS